VKDFFKKLFFIMLLGQITVLWTLECDESDNQDYIINLSCDELSDDDNSSGYELLDEGSLSSCVKKSYVKKPSNICCDKKCLTTSGIVGACLVFICGFAALEVFYEGPSNIDVF